MSTDIYDRLPEYKGSYILEIYIKYPINTRVGALGKHEFPTGFYYYAGSARNKSGIRKRVARYLVLNRRLSLEQSGMQHNPKIHWHIDYILHKKEVEISSMFFSSKLTECNLANDIKNQIITSNPVLDFGSSDCLNGCRAHLFYSGTSAMKHQAISFDDVINLKKTI